MDLALIRRMRQAGQHEEAQKLLLRWSAEAPDNAELLYETAAVHDFLGLEQEAVPFYRAAIAAGLAAEPLRGAYLGLGSTLRTLGQYQAAADVFTQGLAHFPEAAELRVFLAMVAYNLGDHHNAVSALLHLLVDTTRDPNILHYERAIRFYAADLDRTW